MLLFLLVSSVHFEMCNSTCVHSSLESKERRYTKTQSQTNNFRDIVHGTAQNSACFPHPVVLLQAFAERLMHRKIPQPVFLLSHVHQKKSVLIEPKYLFTALRLVLSLQIN